MVLGKGWNGLAALHEFVRFDGGHLEGAQRIAAADVPSRSETHFAP